MNSKIFHNRSILTCKGYFFGLSILISTMCFGTSAMAQEAEDSASEVVEGDENTTLKDRSKRKKRKRNRKRMRNKRNAVEKKQPSSADSTKDQSEGGVEKSSAWLPDWPAASFDWDVGPIVGFKLTSNSDETGRTDTSTSEIGAKAGVFGIPVVPGNPGLQIGVNAGGAFGSVSTKTGDDGVKIDTVNYKRYFGALTLVVPVSFYKHTLGIGAGLKMFDADEAEGVRSFTISNDFAFRLLNWWSLHYTDRSLVGYTKKFKEPFMDEHDSWLHSRIFFSFLSFYLDLGPGLTYTKIYAPDPHEVIAKGQTDYFKAITSAHIFWKLAMSGQAKYVYRSTDTRLGQFAGVDLPEQSVDDPRTLTMPEDSLVTSVFLGINDLFAGVGFGWVYNVQMLNLSKKDGAETAITRDHGFRVTYSASL